MLKKFLQASPLLLLLAAALPAQQTVSKVLIVAGKQPGNAMVRAVQLKQAGIEVEILFEREAILPFLDVNNVLTTPGWKQKMDAIAAEDAVLSSTATLQGPLAVGTAKHPKLNLLQLNFRAGPPFKKWLKDLKQAGVKYTICAASAKNMYEVYDELKAAGEPLSPLSDAPVDLSPYIKQGYQVLMY